MTFQAHVINNAFEIIGFQDHKTIGFRKWDINGPVIRVRANKLTRANVHEANGYLWTALTTCE